VYQTETILKIQATNKKRNKLIHPRVSAFYVWNKCRK